MQIKYCQLLKYLLEFKTTSNFFKFVKLSKHLKIVNFMIE